MWNQLLNMQIERYHNGGKFVSEFDIDYLIVQLKKEYPFLNKVDSRSLLHVSRDLNSAFQKLFKEHSGYPKFKSRKFPKQSYQSSYTNNNICQVGRHRLKVPKLGTIYFRSGRQIEGKIKNVTIRLSSTGKFYAIVLVDTEVNVLDSTNQSIGIDMGVADLMITSDGIKYLTIRFDKLLAKKKHYWEKRLARRRLQANKEISWDHHNKVLEPRELSDFKNYLKAKHMVAKYSEKIANQRNNYLHILTKQLEYKCDWYGKQLVTVNPRKTNQICSTCGYDDGKHTLDIRQWTCPHCGTNHDRDINAAINILNA